MTVISTHQDAQALTLTFVAEFDADPTRVWQVWEDPRQLERWWGPPTWPATFDRHEFAAGGQCRYHMTGPDGEKARGWWAITAVEPPRRLAFDDGFSGDDGEPLPEPGMHVVVTLAPVDGRTRMTTVVHFVDTAQYERLAEMGMAEGMREALGQVDALLAGSR